LQGLCHGENINAALRCCFLLLLQQRINLCP
jgi:hypothetical protein